MLNHNFQDIDALEKKHKKLMIEIFAKNIRTIRLSKKLSQEKVSGMAGISAKYLQEIEAARKSPSARVVFQLSKALNVPICRILPARRCPRINGDMGEEISKLFMGKEERDIQKAIRILSIFLNE